MSDQIIRVEHWVYGRQLEDEMFATVEEAARTAAYACDQNTSWYGEARNIETGETWDRTTLLRLGWDQLEAADEDA